MNLTKAKHLWFIMVAAAAFAAGPAEQQPLSVAVTEPDIQAIVAAVGINQVETFALFSRCILRENLAVEPAVKNRLAKADVLVWTGFLNESAAITSSLEETKATSMGAHKPVHWIDVSKSVARANVPTSNCYGYVDPKLIPGDPFFWLNPENGAIIARNVAEGLARIRPQQGAFFRANAQAFKFKLEKDIARWKQELTPLAHLRVFSAQCGWHNFSNIGGPAFVICTGNVGTLPSPQSLIDRVRQAKADIVMLDPNTPADYGNAFREQPDFRVIEVASSIENIPGAHSYNALFENLIQTLQRAARN